MTLDSKVPGGPLADKWDRHKFEIKLVNPANKRKYTIIVVGTGLAGASAAASLGELGYNVLQLLHPRQPAPRAQHRRAGRHQRGEELPERRRQRLPPVLRHDQGRRLPRARGQRLPARAAVACNIIDQCVAQGVPFAREYGGLLDNRSFGGAQVSRTFYARGQTGQQLLLGAYQALMRQVRRGHGDACSRAARCSIWSSIDGKARGIVVPQPGDRRDRAPRRPTRSCSRTGGYGTAYYLSTNAVNSNVTAAWRAHKRGALLRQPVLHADPPDLHPGQRRSPVEAHADERDRCATTAASGCRRRRATSGRRSRFPKRERDYYLERKYPSFGNLVPRDVASRNAKAGLRRRPRRRRDRARRVSRLRRRHHSGSASTTIKARYGNLFDMYKRITDEDPYKVPMRIYPAIHYTMGGLWVDYNLMSNAPGPARARRGELLATTARTASAPAR